MAQTGSKASNSQHHLTDHYTKNYCEENIYWLALSLLEQSNLNSIFVVFISNQSQQIPIWSQRSSTRPDKLAVWDYHVILLALPSSGVTDNTTTRNNETQQRESSPPLVFDLDSILPSPSPIADFIHHALVINSSKIKTETHRRLFRVVPAASYLAHFSSDRSHMLKSNLLSKTDSERKNGFGGGGGNNWAAADARNIYTNEYMSPPPSYPCIVSSTGVANTFPNYLEMPSYDQAVSNWKESPLEKIIKNRADGGGDAPLDVELSYGVVLTEDAFLEFATRITVL
ncbi:hypothetical protein Ndes2526B_g01936 [Nannochloris sp. 'desiccata']|nr:putative Protein N-terminal glutamine amidohydrolase [Chlorella desiccata (nom. nud.)]